uniref:Uncharacterized protein n=1 Tax=Arundo donax TaxID=35708 RepID=A0A0A9C7R1_ARUDO
MAPCHMNSVKRNRKGLLQSSCVDNKCTLSFCYCTHSVDL